MKRLNCYKAVFPDIFFKSADNKSALHVHMILITFYTHVYLRSERVGDDGQR